MAKEEEHKQVQLGPKTIEVPEDWDMLRLIDITEVESSNVDKKSKKDEFSVRLCNYLDVYNNEYIDESLEFMEATATEREINRFALKRGDVIITKDSEKANDIAKSSVIIESIENLVCGYHLTLLRPKGDIVDGVFLSKLLQSQPVNSQFTAMAQGLTRFGLTVPSIKNAQVPLPPLPEQRKIASILSTVDNAIRQTDEVVEKAQELKRGLMQDLLTKGIGHEEFKEVQIGPKAVEIPEEWKIQNIESISERLITGGTPSTDMEDYWGGNIPWTTCAYVDGPLFDGAKDYITQNGLKNSSANLVPEGGILFGTRVDVANSAKTVKDVAISQDLTGIIVNEDIVDPDFLTWYFTHNKDNISEQYRQGSTISGMLTSDLRGLKIPLPSLSEQKKIVERLSTVDEKIQEEKEYKEKLQDLKKGLMQDLLTGKVRVN